MSSSSADVVGLSVSSTVQKDSLLVCASLQPSSSSEPRASDICCVVDVSGSMGTEAKTQNNQGNVETHGLSLLDIVKHAVKTIIHILHPADRLSVVCYATNARVVFPLTNMTEDGKAKALSEVEALKTEDMTNLWGGLHAGLEVLRTSTDSKGRLQSVLLLTDGQPNVEPPGGHLPSLKKYKDDNQQLSCIINTFGFGYNLDSKLLQELATEGNGMYAFIPDSSFVGTAFVHATSNMLATMGTNVKVSLELKKGASLHEKPVLGGHPFHITSWGVQVDIGSLQYDQVKDIIFRVHLPKGAAPTQFGSVTVKYCTKDKEAPSEHTVEGEVSSNATKEIEVQQHRLHLVDGIREAMSLMRSGKEKDAQKIVKDLIEQMRSSETKTDKRVEGLIEDLQGQCTEALSRPDWFKKWGAHYLPSLLNAHRLQMCNNFKDPGVQLYGGQLFTTLRDRADDIFVKLPPPKPSYKAAAPVQSMHYYHSSANPCFHPNSLVHMSNGTFKKVQHIRKGDLLASNGNPVKVSCVVKTLCQSGTAELVTLGEGLMITPYHPVRINGRWNFPCDLGQVEHIPCSHVYNFVLEDTHVMTINGVECVTLGHNFQENVVQHSYFGSQQVIRDLQKMVGWCSGLIELLPNCLMRDSKSLMVCGFHQQVQMECV